MSDRFVGLGLPRAFACVIRQREAGPELLVFDHPFEGTQIPKGRIDSGESPRRAARRELAEESGLDLEPSRFIGRLRQRFEHPVTADAFVTEDWYVWQFDALPTSPESWTHLAEEEGMEFAYRWVPLTGDTAGLVHHYFRAVIELIEPPPAPSDGEPG